MAKPPAIQDITKTSLPYFRGQHCRHKAIQPLLDIMQKNTAPLMAGASWQICQYHLQFGLYMTLHDPDLSSNQPRQVRVRDQMQYHTVSHDLLHQAVLQGVQLRKHSLDTT